MIDIIIGRLSDRNILDEFLGHGAYGKRIITRAMQLGYK